MAAQSIDPWAEKETMPKSRLAIFFSQILAILNFLIFLENYGSSSIPALHVIARGRSEPRPWRCSRRCSCRRHRTQRRASRRRCLAAVLHLLLLKRSYACARREHLFMGHENAFSILNSFRKFMFDYESFLNYENAFSVPRIVFTQ